MSKSTISAETKDIQYFGKKLSRMTKAELLEVIEFLRGQNIRLTRTIYEAEDKSRSDLTKFFDETDDSDWKEYK